MLQEETYLEMITKFLVCFFIIPTHFGGLTETLLHRCGVLIQEN